MINYIEKYNSSIYYILSLVAFSLFIMQRFELFSLKIGNAFPQLLLPLVVTVACFLREWTGFLFGLLSGIALDTVMNGTGFLNTVLFLLIGLFAGLLFRFILNRNLKSVMLAGTGFSFLYFLIRWLFLSLFAKDASAGAIFLSYELPSAIYTALFTLPFFYLTKWLAKKYLIQKN